VRPRSPASDADKDHLLGVLREHYARGTIDDAELDRRSEIVLTARFTDEAASAIADLPLLTGTGQAGQGQVGQGQAAVSRSSGRSRHRHAQADRPGLGWVPTSERFRDPSSMVIMRVWIDPADDSRHYVPEREGT
jgi:hypothetical protein